MLQALSISYGQPDRDVYMYVWGYVCMYVHIFEAKYLRNWER